ncbi:hypothetical protein BHM03_00031156 [Ensete ventricosum]|nr:hypothetical protein BHM03_00031156 [Ensete ventricosum]
MMEEIGRLGRDFDDDDDDLEDIVEKLSRIVHLLKKLVGLVEETSLCAKALLALLPLLALALYYLRRFCNTENSETTRLEETMRSSHDANSTLSSPRKNWLCRLGVHADVKP